MVHVSNILKCFISMHYLAGLNFTKVGGSFARRCNTLNLHGHSLVSRDMIKQALYLMGKFFVILLFLYGVCRLALDNYVSVEDLKLYLYSYGAEIVTRNRKNNKPLQHCCWKRFFINEKKSSSLLDNNFKKNIHIKNALIVCIW